MDNRTPGQRSHTMSRIRGYDTSPERAVRKMLFAAGYRYRLHVRNLPGHPDIAFPRSRKVIFVNGCFWHAHAGCVRAKVPATRPDYWLPKLRANAERDKRIVQELRDSGWEAITIWECELKNENVVRKRLLRFLGNMANGTVRRVHRVRKRSRYD
jgi:DNA mismatch endonuclease (patch repair protein)